MKIKLLYIVILFTLFSCSKEDSKPSTSGEILLSSQIIGDQTSYHSEGFSFETAKKVKYSLTSSSVPDILIERFINIQGEVIGGNLTSPKNEAAFYKAGEFSSLTEAETYFNQLLSFTASTFTPTMQNIQPNQVYIFQSRSNKYAKILIKSVNIIEGVPSKNSQVTIQWAYQPNGEKAFE